MIAYIHMAILIPTPLLLLSERRPGTGKTCVVPKDPKEGRKTLRMGLNVR